MFFVDFTQRLNDLGIKLQGDNKIITSMLDTTQAFQIKLAIFNREIMNKNSNYFPKFIWELEFMEPDIINLIQEFSSIIEISMNEFSTRFTQFREFEETMKIVIYLDNTLPLEKLNLSV